MLARRDPLSPADCRRQLKSRGPAERLVLLALPGNYLRMIEHELLRLPERLLSRVRLFSGAADVALPASACPDALRWPTQRKEQRFAGDRN